MLVVVSYWGTSKTRMEVTAKAMKYLAQMNPMPRVVFVEGAVNNVYHFPSLSKCGFSYVPVSLADECFRNLFVKEILWNVGVQQILTAGVPIKKLVYLDSDCAFVDQMSFQEINRALDLYDVISPMRAAYYADTDADSAKYGMLHSTGYNVLKAAKKSGWPGFSVAMTTEFLAQYFNYQIPCSGLGFGDCIFWYLLTARNQMRSFSRIPYSIIKLQKYVLPTTVRIGYADTVLMHLYHGSIIDRQYKVKCRLMQRAIREPFSDLKVLGKGLLCWNDTPEVKTLRCCVENLLMFNRQDVKLYTEQDADQLYDWVIGRRPMPPTKIHPTRFAPHGNLMPNGNVSFPVPSKVSQI